ncbi:MAG: asparaginase [Deltaproteobacteria bacterium]|nr:asparaginase [Deltaproteobacteria bacterium]
MSAMPTVVARRGQLVEARHPFAYAVADASGALLRTAGRIAPTPWRSAAKPFQLEVSLGCLPEQQAEVLMREPALLAIAAASHSAEPGHIDHVDRLLALLQLPLDALRCGTHRPMSVEAADAWLRSGRSFDDRHNNCSGKHALMAAAARALCADHDYRPAEHPLQRRIHALLETLVGAPVDHGIDGCGVPTFGLDVIGMARAFAALARPANPLRAAVAAAVAQHPWLVSGTARLDHRLAERANEPWIGKIGALGVFCIALPARGLGVALKIESGGTDALGAAIEAVIAEVAPGALRAVAGEWEPLLIRNVVGVPVGSYRATLD